MYTIKVKDFAEVPGLRSSKISEDSGEDYYHEQLNTAFAEAYRTKNKLEVDLDGTRGLLPSFLDEAFGNLVYDFSLKWVKELIVITSTIEPHWIPYIWKKSDEWESRRVGQQNRIVTKTHEPWYALVDDKLVKKQWSLPS
jgi:hypothetical protein